MSVLILGSEGSMGKRYQAILNHLDVEHSCADKNTKKSELFQLTKSAEKMIIATPTETHFDFLCEYAHLGIPILCEKPLSKNLFQLETIRSLVKDEGLNLTMTLQYKYLDTGVDGPSYYNYFRHGSDGLLWDCLQVIGLARDSVTISEKSPVWKCALNGKKLNLSDMDRAYVDFVKQWLLFPGDDIDRIIEMHLKVMEMDVGKAG